MGCFFFLKGETTKRRDFFKKSPGFAIFFQFILEVGNHTEKRPQSCDQAAPLLRVERRSYWSRCRREGGVKNRSSDQLTLILCCFSLGILPPIHERFRIASIGIPITKPVQWNVTRVLNHCSYGNSRELSYVNSKCGPLPGFQ